MNCPIERWLMCLFDNADDGYWRYGYRLYLVSKGCCRADLQNFCSPHRKQYFEANLLILNHFISTRVYIRSPLISILYFGIKNNKRFVRPWLGIVNICFWTIFDFNKVVACLLSTYLLLTNSFIIHHGNGSNLLIFKEDCLIFMPSVHCFATKKETWTVIFLNVGVRFISGFCESVASGTNISASALHHTRTNNISKK